MTTLTYAHEAPSDSGSAERAPTVVPTACHGDTEPMAHEQHGMCRFICDVCGREGRTQAPRVMPLGLEPPWRGWLTIWAPRGEVRIDLCPEHRP